jgi:hypothetical protein
MHRKEQSLYLCTTSNTRRSFLSYLKRDAQPSVLDIIKREFECFE